MMGKSSTLFPLDHKDDVTIYHDETKQASGKNIWGHGILFVPHKKIEGLLKELQDARDECICDSKLRFADISESYYTPKYECVKRWVEIGFKYLKRNEGCKLGIIFFDKGTVDLNAYSGDKKERELRAVETVLRMTLKGSAHYLYDTERQVKIHRFVTDGDPWHRDLNENRIIGRLLTEVRDYVEITPGCKIDGVVSDHKNDRCNDIKSAHLLQLTDLLLGSVIQTCFRDLEQGKKKEIIIRPIKEMLDKRKRGRKGFENSSHFRSFTLSLAKIVCNEWQFERLDSKDIIIDDSTGKITLSDLNI